MKDELDGKTKKRFVVLRLNMHSYLMDKGLINKKWNYRKKFVMKREIKFKDYKECLGKNKTIMKFQQMFRNEAHNSLKGQQGCTQCKWS